MDPPAKPSHHSAKVSTGSPGLPLRGNSSACDSLSRTTLPVRCAVWVRVGVLNRSAAKRLVVLNQSLGEQGSGISCATNTTTSAATPPLLL